jgi:hypothetical protein
MKFSVGLYRDFARQGRITFRTLPATKSSDYVSKPDGILSPDEAEHLSRQLRRTPAVCQGVVGKYVWRQEEV